MSIKPQINQKLWTVRFELNDGIVQKHPITGEMDFVDNTLTRQAAHIYHVTKNEAIDGIINYLLTLKETNTNKIISLR